MPRVKQILVTREEKIYKDEPKNELEFQDDENQQEEEEFFKNEPNSREKHDKNDEIPKPNHDEADEIISESKNDLKKLLRLQRDFKCDKCNFTFYEEKRLKKHISQIHDGQKKHPCEVCDKKFTSSYYLKDHLYNMHYAVYLKRNYIFGIEENKNETESDFEQKPNPKPKSNYEIKNLELKEGKLDLPFGQKLDKIQILKGELKKLLYQQKSSENNPTAGDNSQEILSPNESNDQFEDPILNESSQKNQGDNPGYTQDDNPTDKPEGDNSKKIKEELSSNSFLEDNIRKIRLEDTDLEQKFDHQNLESPKPLKDSLVCENCKQLYTFKSFFLHLRSVKNCSNEGKSCRDHYGDIYENGGSKLQNLVKAYEKMIQISKTCEYCGKEFTRVSTLTYHKRVDHEGLPYNQCDRCKKSFTSKSSLKYHIKYVHEGQRDVSCDICGKEFTRKTELDRHTKNVHEGKREHICNICGNKAYAHKRSLIDHIKVYHEGIKPLKKHKCHLCSFKFSFKFDLTRHLSTFACQKMECEKCHAKIRIRNHKNHLKYCGRAKLKCHLCDRSFYSSNLLSEHIQIVHEGHQLYPYKCQSCGKPFAKELNLERHIQAIHEDPKDYKCDECPKRFSKESRLKVHIRNMHDGRYTNKCDFCGQTKSTSKAFVGPHSPGAQSGRGTFT